MGNTRACLCDDGNDEIKSEVLLLRESVSESRSRVFDNSGGNGIQRKSGEIFFLEEEEEHFLQCGGRSIWTQMHQVDSFCGGKMSEFISNDFYFLNEV